MTARMTAARDDPVGGEPDDGGGGDEAGPTPPIHVLVPLFVALILLGALGAAVTVLCAVVLAAMFIVAAMAGVCSVALLLYYKYLAGDEGVGDLLAEARAKVDVPRLVRRGRAVLAAVVGGVRRVWGAAVEAAREE